MFPDEDSARKWFEETRWPNGRACAKCGSVKNERSSERYSHALLVLRLPLLLQRQARYAHAGLQPADAQVGHCESTS